MSYPVKYNRFLYGVLLVVPVLLIVFAVSFLFQDVERSSAAPLTGADLDLTLYGYDAGWGLSDDTIDANDEDIANTSGTGGYGDVDWPETMTPTVYFGHATTKFDRVYIKVDSLNGGDDVSFDLEYWNGSSWTDIDETYTTHPFSNIGTNYFEFSTPENWATTSVNSVTAYYVRINSCDTGCKGPVNVSQISLREYVSNTAPVATAIITSQTDATTVSVETTIADADSDVTSLTVEYSTDNISWSSSTIGIATENSEGDGTTTSTGNIADIDTDNDGSIALTFTWNVGADLADTDDTTVYLRVIPNDGTVDGTTVSSSAFAIDTADPSAPSALATTTINTTSVILTLPTTTSTDTNFSEYKIFYKAGTSSVAITDTAFTSSSDSNLASSTYAGATTTTISGLSEGTAYVFNIWAYDSYENSTSSASELTFTTRATPTSSSFTGSGTTDFSSVSDLTAVENMVLATANGRIYWNTDVNANGEDYNSLVRIGSEYVSVDTASADSSLDANATLTLTLDDGGSSRSIYYASSFYSSASEIISNGQVCNESTTPACTSVSYSGSSFTFTVPQLDSYAVLVQSGGGGSIMHLLPIPEPANFLINGGDVSTDKREVNLAFHLSNEEDIKEMAISETDDFSSVNYIPFEDNYMWTLSEGAGEKTIYVFFRLENGRTIDVKEKINYIPNGDEKDIVEEVLFEGEPIGFTINGGASMTEVRDVRLAFNIGSASEMAISETDDFSSVNYIPFEDNYMWTLSEGAGEKMIYVRLRATSGRTIDIKESILYSLNGVDTIIEEEKKVESIADVIASGGCPVKEGKSYKHLYSAAVYYVTPECRKKLFLNPALYFSHYTSWEFVELTTKEIIASIPHDSYPYMLRGPLVELRSGSLVKIITDSRIYLILGTQRHWIMTSKIFEGLKYMWNWVEGVSQELLDVYEEGEPIDTFETHPVDTIIKYKGDESKYIIKERQNVEGSGAYKVNRYDYRDDRIIELDKEK